MNKIEIIDFKKALIEGRIIWRQHAFERMLERNISREEVKKVVREGEIIERYETDRPFPSFLMMKVFKNRPLHVVVGFDSRLSEVHIITVYEPTLDKFEEDFKTRRIL